MTQPAEGATAMLHNVLSGCFLYHYNSLVSQPSSSQPLLPNFCQFFTTPSFAEWGCIDLVFAAFETDPRITTGSKQQHFYSTADAETLYYTAGGKYPTEKSCDNYENSSMALFFNCCSWGSESRAVSVPIQKWLVPFNGHLELSSPVLIPLVAQNYIKKRK